MRTKDSGWFCNSRHSFVCLVVAAKAFGFHRVELTVREDNTNAIALYKQIGFAKEGVQRDAVRVDGVYEDLILMAVLF